MPRHHSRAVRVLLVGWGLFLVMVGIVVVARPDDRAAMVVFTVVAMALAAWVVRRGSQASIVASLAVGLLHTAEQVAYTYAGVTEPVVDAVVVAGDVVGLLSGLLITGGAAGALRGLRAPRSY